MEQHFTPIKIGECVAAFCDAVLSKSVVPPGVWFPEEAIAGGADAATILELTSVVAHTLQVESSDLDLSCEEVWGSAKR
jgi:hypothetical protein